MGKSKLCSFSPISNLRYLQVNLKHCEEACDNLLIFMIQNDIDIAFLQEPWVNGPKILSPRHPNFNIFHKGQEGVSTRACILAKS